MNTNHTLESLLDIFRQSFDAAAKTAFEPVCGVRRSRDEALEFTHREAIKAVLDAIGYQFPIDPEREAYEKWLSDKQAKPEPYDAWKAGREELRKQSGPANGSDTPETFEAHGHTWFKHTPGDPMPCEGGRRVFLLFRDEEVMPVLNSIYVGWTRNEGKSSDIIGWRYAE